MSCLRLASGVSSLRWPSRDTTARLRGLRVGEVSRTGASSAGSSDCGEGVTCITDSGSGLEALLRDLLGFGSGVSCTTGSAAVFSGLSSGA